MRGENIIADTNYIGNSILEKIANSYIEDENKYSKQSDKENTTTKFTLDMMKKERISVSSKKELIKMGFRDIGGGFRIDSKHHLWTLTREGNGYVIERNADEEVTLKAKECKTANKKVAVKYEVTTGVFEGHIFNGHPVTISGQERIWDDDSVGRSYPIENTKLVETKTSSKITIKSEVPVGQFLSDLSQSGIYYQKISEVTDEDKIATVVLDIDDSDKENFMNMAKDNNIVVEATKVAYQSDVFGMINELYENGEISDFDNARINQKFNELESLHLSDELTYEQFYRAFGDWVEKEFPYLKEKLGAKLAAIEESQKVFSDEAVYSGVKHYMNMGFTKKEAIDNFIESFNLDKSYEIRIKETLEKYNI